MTHKKWVTTLLFPYFFFSFQLFSKPELIMCSEFRKNSTFIFLFRFRFPRVHRHNQSHFILTWYHMPLSKPAKHRYKTSESRLEAKNMNKKVWNFTRQQLHSMLSFFALLFMHIAMWYVLFITKKCNRKCGCVMYKMCHIFKGQAALSTCTNLHSKWWVTNYFILLCNYASVCVENDWSVLLDFCPCGLRINNRFIQVREKRNPQKNDIFCSFYFCR